MDYIQTLNYWGNSYWGGGYWGAVGTRRSEIFRLNLVMNFSIETLGIVKMEVPAVQVMNKSMAGSAVMNVKEETKGILNKLISDRYDELEEV